MRIVLIHRYFWPDTPPYAHILRDIAVALGARGHRVTVLTCQPSYDDAVSRRAPRNEQLAPGVEIRRFPVLADRRSSLLKAFNLVWFCLRLLMTCRSLRGVDVVMAASTPPLAVARLGSVLARRTGARFVYHKQDIYPEVVSAPGILRSRRLADLLRRFDAATDRRANRVVVLSDDMRQTIVGRGVDGDRVVVLNNFDPWQVAEAPPAEGPNAAADRNRRLQVVFAGNLGRFQNLETLVAAVLRIGPNAPLDLHFFGNGALAPTIREQVTRAGLDWVYLHGHRPPGEVAHFLRSSADLGIVSLAPGVIRAAYPSKTMSYLRQGCPVLALVEADSALVQTIVGAGAGMQVSPTDPDVLADALLRAVGDRQWLRQARPCAAALYAREYAREHQLDRWTELFEALGSGLAA